MVKIRKYLVIYNTKSGGTGAINVFSTKAEAIKQVTIAKKSKSFKQLGFSKPRVVLNEMKRRRK